jgi:hypothetical protein
LQSVRFRTVKTVFAFSFILKLPKPQTPKPFTYGSKLLVKKTITGHRQQISEEGKSTRHCSA